MKNLVAFITVIICLSSCAESEQVPMVTLKDFDIHCEHYLDDATDMVEASQVVIGIAPGNSSGFDWQSFQITLYPIVNGQLGGAVVSNDILLTNESNTKQFDAKKDIDTFVSVSPSYQSSINYDKNEKIKVYYPPNNYFNSYLSSLDSRGPPSLG